MASIVVSGDTSGAITIAAPAIAGTNTLTLPASTGTLVVTGGAQTIEFADGSASAPSITNSGDTNTGIFFPAADTIAFTEGGVESMRINSSGNVGIGTTSPSCRLDLNRGSAGLLANFTDGVNTNFQIETASLLATIGPSAGSTGMAFKTGNTERMRIDSSGNVGIGVTPSAKLDVYNSAAAAANNEILRLRYVSSTTAGHSGDLNFTNQNGTVLGRISSVIQDGSNVALAFGTYNSSISEKMRITAGGNLLVNTTTVRNSGKVSIDFAGNSAGGLGINDTDSVNGGVYAGFLSGGTFRGSITNNNNTAVAYNTTSDYRLKENIAPMTGALAKVAQLKPCTYTWKETGDAGQGFIAHELQEVIPDAVTGEKDAVETYIDEDGSEQTRPKYQGVDTSFLVATLTAAIQEQQQIINDLKARIETLEGNR